MWHHQCPSYILLQVPLIQLRLASSLMQKASHHITTPSSGSDVQNLPAWCLLIFPWERKVMADKSSRLQGEDSLSFFCCQEDEKGPYIFLFNLSSLRHSVCLVTLL